MQNHFRILLASIASLAPAIPAQAQTVATPPQAQVPGPVTSAPSSAFAPPPSPVTAVNPLDRPITDRSTSTPAIPSIEARPLPLPSTARGGPVPSTSRTQAPGGPGALPAPVERPLAVDMKNDPVLALGREAGSGPVFRDAIVAAVDRNPSLAEAEAQADEARGQRREARAGLFPTVDLNATGFKTVSREFGNDPDNIIERSRPRQRIDAQASVNQTLLDFGATTDRIAAAGARLRAASAGLDDTAAQVALRTIGAWYDVFTYRTLIAIGRTYLAAQAQRRDEFAQRVAQGYNASVDVARLDSSVASLNTRLARFTREVANAEARFVQLTGRPVPANLSRAPYLGDLPRSLDDARFAAASVPAVRAVAEQADAARRDAQAAKADTFPNFSAGIDAGRYGVLQDRPDYDIRARLTIRKRLFGGLDARLDQVRARAAGAGARSARVTEEAARDAAIAWTDLEALNEQTRALEQSYIAARLSRDTIEERFRVSRGTLFDVIDANDAYFGAATAYVESLADRDAAHYVVLARTGRLLPALRIESAYDRVRQ